MVKFEDMFEIGDFVKYHNIICSVESFEKRKRYFLRRDVYSEFCYVLKPLSGQSYLMDGREFEMYEEDIETYEWGDMTITSPSKVTEEQLIEEMARYIDTKEVIGETTCIFDDNSVALLQDEGSIYLSPEEAIELKDLINKYVGEK